MTSRIELDFYPNSYPHLLMNISGISRIDRYTPFIMFVCQHTSDVPLHSPGWAMVQLSHEHPLMS